jgi:alcohol dehydrogenase class IV
VVASLIAGGVSVVRFAVRGEPTIGDARTGVDLARAAGCDLVVAVGGGSALDAGKAVAALAANPGDVLDYLEVVGAGRPLTAPGLPFVAVPTTAGSGSEVTRNAVLAAPDAGVKASLRSPFMLPRVALVDPDLARDLPPDVTAATGLDAIAQLIEPYLSTRATPFTDALCGDGIARAARALTVACRDGGDASARGDMALASLFGGMALANAGLGAVHGFAGPIGGRFRAPHGAVCAALLPHVLRVNVRALADRIPDSPVRARADRVGQWLTGRAHAGAGDAVSWLDAVRRDLAIPSLRAYGIGAADVPRLVAQARLSSSLRSNPVDLTDEELAEILQAAL